jgi:hypothetical protein
VKKAEKECRKQVSFFAEQIVIGLEKDSKWKADFTLHMLECLEGQIEALKEHLEKSKN